MTIKRLSVVFIWILITLPTYAGTPAPTIGKLYWVGGNQLARANLDGSEFEVLVSELDAPDGLVVDLSQQMVVWTNMSRGPNGSLQRSNLQGEPLPGDGKYLVAPASFETGKEIELDTTNSKLYWADRDGKKILRANIDGSNLETVVERFKDSDGQTVALENPVGIALDLNNRHLYFTDRFMARVMRVDLDGPLVDIRSDVETLIRGDRDTSRPIDIDLDLENQYMYWTDRGEHSISVAKLDGSKAKVIVDSAKVTIKDPIGISLDLASETLVWTDMSTHTIHRANLDGSNIKTILAGERLLNGVPYGPLGIVTKALQPDSGGIAGGEEVFLVGDNFIDGRTEVLLGRVRAKDVVVLNANLLRFSTPPGTKGRVDITVRTPGGESRLAKGFNYQ